MKRGAKVKAHDPIALENARKYFGDLGVHYYDSIFETVQDADAVVLVTEWTDYRKIDWEAIKPLMKTPLILDGRNFLPRQTLEQIGFHYVGVGIGGVRAAYLPNGVAQTI